MEAQLVEEIPVGRQWQYQPKWDGFRCLALRDGGRIELVVDGGRPRGDYMLHDCISKTTRMVPTTDTRIEPRQPTRLE